MTDDLVDVPLTDDERQLLRAGLADWGGPARCTDALAAAMGFRDRAGLSDDGDVLRARLRDRKPLSPEDWRRTLLATEVVFASDVVGSGLDWPVTAGFSDEVSLRLLRSVQRKVLGVVGRTPCPGPTAPDVRR